MSHIDQDTLDDVVKQLNDVFRTNKTELAETKGDIYKYLGLIIDFSKKSHVIFIVIVYSC